MKKTYQKPEILFEDFSLSVNIAGDCSIRTNTPSEGTCAYEIKVGFATWNVFTDAVAACTTKESRDGSADEIYNSICYHVPYDNSSLFNS